jgi:hypothetical protein
MKFGGKPMLFLSFGPICIVELGADLGYGFAYCALGVSEVWIIRLKKLDAAGMERSSLA